MKDTQVLETRKVKDHVYRKRLSPNGDTFWTIEYEISKSRPSEVAQQEKEDTYQREMRRRKEEEDGCERR